MTGDERRHQDRSAHSSAGSACAFPEDAFVHWCESCGREDLLESQDAYEAGWDFPPRMGTWGVVSPRTCPLCAIRTTVWWTIAIENQNLETLGIHQRKVIGRILNEVFAVTGDEDAVSS